MLCQAMLPPGRAAQSLPAHENAWPPVTLRHYSTIKPYKQSKNVRRSADDRVRVSRPQPLTVRPGGITNFPDELLDGESRTINQWSIGFEPTAIVRNRFSFYAALQLNKSRG